MHPFLVWKRKIPASFWETGIWRGGVGLRVEQEERAVFRIAPNRSAIAELHPVSTVRSRLRVYAKLATKGHCLGESNFHGLIRRKRTRRSRRASRRPPAEACRASRCRCICFSGSGLRGLGLIGQARLIFSYSSPCISTLRATLCSRACQQREI